MLFNSFEYVVFLVMVFLAFWGLVRFRMLRAVILLVASYAFYMSWNATFVFLILGSTILDYCCGLWISKTENPLYKKLLLGVSLFANLGILGLFKYYDFFVDAVARGLTVIGLHAEPAHLGLVLPVGISFYTFQTLSYTIDVYRGSLKATKNFVEFALFVAFFPQLVAGPIVRASEFLPQYDRKPTLDTERAWSGIFLIGKGLVKKILIADYLAANLLDRVFEQPHAASSLEVMVALYGYTWQLYGDFSGYTDIARGSARLIGFELPENFKRPFQAKNVAEFWRRWHITLSRWFTDYLYKPLGAAQKGALRAYVNVAVTFLVVGIWHGAGWNFILFGAWHAFGLVTYRLWQNSRPLKDKKEARGWKAALFMFLTLHFHIANWPLFRARNLRGALEVYEQLFAFELTPFRVSPLVLLIIIGSYAFHYTPVEWVERAEKTTMRWPPMAQAGLIAILASVMMLVSAANPAPFIYFQF